MFESQIMSGYFIYFPGWQKLKQKVRFPFPHKFAGDIFSELKIQHCYSDFDAGAKEISVFQNPFHCAVEELPPNLQL